MEKEPNRTSAFKFTLRDVVELTTVLCVILAIESVIQRLSDRGIELAFLAWSPGLVALIVARRPKCPVHFSWLICGVALMTTSMAACYLRGEAEFFLLNRTDPLSTGDEEFSSDLPPIARPANLLFAQLTPLCVFLIAFVSARLASPSRLGKLWDGDGTALAVVILFLCFLTVAGFGWFFALCP